MAQILSFEDLSVSFATVLATAMTEALSTEMDVIVDAGAAERVDAAGLQIFISAQRTATERGSSLVVQVPSGGPVARALDIYGLLSPEGVAAQPFRLVTAKRA